MQKGQNSGKPKRDLRNGNQVRLRNSRCREIIDMINKRVPRSEILAIIKEKWAVYRVGTKGDELIDQAIRMKLSDEAMYLQIDAPNLAQSLFEAYQYAHINYVNIMENKEQPPDGGRWSEADKKRAMETFILASEQFASVAGANFSDRQKLPPQEIIAHISRDSTEAATKELKPDEKDILLKILQERERRAEIEKKQRAQKK